MPKRQPQTRSKTQQKAVLKENCRPTEQPSLGKWNPELISSCFQDDSNVFLEQSLFDASKDFFFPPKLEEIAKMELHHDLLPRSDNNKPKLFLQVGTIQALEEKVPDFNYACQSKSIHEVILKFYKQRFKKTEHKYIERYLKDEKIIHLLLFNKYLVQPRPSVIKLEGHLIGALAFRIVKGKVGLIVYLGVHDGGLQLDKLVPEKETKLKKNANKESNTLQRSFYLGTFMICCVQHMLYLNKSSRSYTLVAQVSNAVDGPLYFYKKNFFYIVENDDSNVKKIRTDVPDLVSPDSESLYFMAIGVPLYRIHPWWVQRSHSSPYTIKHIIENGLQFILQWTEKFQKTAESNYSSSKFKNLSMIIPLSQTEKKRIKDERGTLKGDSEKGDKKEFEEFFKENGKETIEVLDLGQGKAENEGSCFFLVFARVLYGNENSYMKLRYFFYYLYVSISMMKLDSYVFDYDSCLQKQMNNEVEDKDWDGLFSLHQLLFSAFDRIWDYYKKATSEIKKYRLRDIKTIFEDNHGSPSIGCLDPSDIQQLFLAYGNAIIDVKFWGGDMEFTLLRSILNIKPYIVELSTSQKSPDIQDELRLWSVSCSSAFGEIPFMYKWFSKKMPKIQLFIGKVDETHFVLIDYKVDLIESDNEAACVEISDDNSAQIYDSLCSKTFSNEKQFVQEWFAERRGKLVPLKKATQINFGSGKGGLTVKPCFEPDSFSHPNCLPTMVPYLAQILDPLKCWLDANKKIGREVRMYDALCLRPNMWVNADILTAYCGLLNDIKTNKDVFFLDFRSVLTISDKSYDNKDYEKSSKLVQKILAGIKSHKKIVFALHFSNNHFITLEVNSDDVKENEKITIHYADGLDPCDDVIPKFSKDNYDKPFLYLLYKVFVEDLDIYEMVHKGIPKKDFVQYAAIPDREKQNDQVNCGILVMRRMYVHSQNGMTFNDLPADVNIFRLFALQQLIMNDPPDYLYKPKMENSQPLLTPTTVAVTADSIPTIVESLNPTAVLSTNAIDVTVTSSPSSSPHRKSKKRGFEDVVTTNDDNHESTPTDLNFPRKGKADSPTSTSSDSYGSTELGFLQDALFNEQVDRMQSDSNINESEEDNEYIQKYLLQETLIEDCIDDSVHDAKDESMDDALSETEMDLLFLDKPRIQIKNVTKAKPTVKKGRSKSRKMNYAKTLKEGKDKFLIYQATKLTTMSARESAKNLPKRLRHKLQKEQEAHSKKLDVENLHLNSDSFFPNAEESWPAPSETEIDKLQTKNYDHLLNLKKRGLTRTQQKKWEDNYFDPSQKDFEAASKALKIYLDRKLKAAQDDYRKAQANYSKEEKKKNKDHRTLRKLSRILLLKKAMVGMRKWEKKQIPIFHPRDSIYAIQCKEYILKNKIIKRYFAAVKQDNGKKFVKEVTLEFLKQNCENEYIKWFEEHEEEKGWLVFDGTQPKFYQVSNTTLIQKMEGLQKIYEFNNPEADKKVEVVRACVFMKEDSDLDDPLVDYIEWAVKIEDMKEYISISEEELKTLVTEMRHFEILQCATHAAITDIKNKHNNKQLKLSKEIETCQQEDPLFRPDLVGDMQAPQIHYTILEDIPELKGNPIMYQTTRSQISKIRYCLLRQKYLGYQITDNTVIELPMWWIEKTFDEEFRDAVKEEALNGRKKFFDVPVSDSFILIPTMDTSMNPIVYYQQYGENTCVFSSFASGLKYLNYSDLATFVIEIGETVLADHKNYASRRMQALMGIFNSSKNPSAFWEYYKCRKISRKFDLFGEKQNINEKDILLITLQQKNNSQSHAVTIVGGYIFDSNVDRALPFTREGINCCCERSEFVGVAKGYFLKALTNDYDFESDSFPLTISSSQPKKETIFTNHDDNQLTCDHSDKYYEEYFLL